MQHRFVILALGVVAFGGGCGSDTEDTQERESTAGTFSLVLIDDLESSGDVAGDNLPHYVPEANGIDGFWETDRGGVTITPDRDDDVVPVDGGADGTGHAVRFQVVDAGCQWGAVIAATFRAYDKDFVTDSPVGFRVAYDASAYAGISFQAKVGPGSANGLRVKTPEPGTVPVANGGTCTSNCWDDYGMGMTLSEEWTRYNVLFDDMTQSGAESAADFTINALYSIDFLVNCTPLGTGGTFDLYLDDISFLVADPNGAIVIE